MVMKIKKNIAVSENGFIFNPSSGESFSANPLGLEILNLLRKGQEKESILKTLGDTYHADEAILERDLNDFIETIRQYHLFDHEDE
jgi:hypothetical protein